MSPKQGRRRTSGKGRPGGSAVPRPTAGPAATRRLGLLVFGAAFVVLFVVVGLAVGVGQPSVPSGDVAIVEGAPGDSSTITEAEFKHALVQSAARAGTKGVPKPSDPKYKEVKEAAMNALFEVAWLQGLAAEMGISVSDKEVASKLKELETQRFKSPAEFHKVVKELHFTSADVNELMKLEIEKEQIQKKLEQQAPKPSSNDVASYYDETKATQFTQKETRDVRTVRNKDLKKVQQALEALNKDDSVSSWKKVAKKYSEDTATKESGGLQRSVQEGVLEEPLGADVFNAKKGQVIGPVKTKQGYTAFEVESSTPESVQDLKTVESQIKAQLEQQAQQEYFTAFVGNFSDTWKSRTYCASGYVVERCANFKGGGGHPSTAPPACYEAHPKGGLPETGCPAPVTQAKPAQPGSYSILKPQGEPEYTARPAQRPHPPGEEESTAESPIPTTFPGG